jgi:serine/threonine protein kinase
MIHVLTEEDFLLTMPCHIGNYAIGNVMGQGASSVVLAAVDRSSGKEYAIKVMSSLDIQNRNIRHKIDRELAIITTLDHENIVRFREVLCEGDLICVVSEKCDGGDLFQYICNGSTADRLTQKRLFRQIALGVQYLHHQGIAHNDLKPENVILDGDGNAKLIDFGFAKTDRIAGDDDKSGTLVYAAPELLSPGSYHTQKADIWSLAILLYTLVTGAMPYPAESHLRIRRRIRAGQLIYDKTMDADATRLIRHMARVNPNERPTIDEILEDHFFDDLLLDGTVKVAPGEATVVREMPQADLDQPIW